MDILEIVGIILGSGGIGSFITWLIQLRSEKRIKAAEADKAETEVASEKQHVISDKFESMYMQINKMIQDYNELSDEYRKYREDSLNKERDFINRISDKCQQLADMRSQIQYLKPLRCYRTDCALRIKTNPDKELK